MIRMESFMKKIIIVGGGAAGMFAAVSAANEHTEVHMRSLGRTSLLPVRVDAILQTDAMMWRNC